MAGKKRRSVIEKQAHQADIARLILLGYDQKQIADELRLTPAMVSRDASEIEDRWRTSALIDFDQARARELARIEMIEREAWDAWDASKKDAETRTQSGGEGLPARAQITKSTRNALKAYLDAVIWCSEQRCKILGLYKTPGEVTVNITLLNQVVTSLQAIGADPEAVLRELMQDALARKNEGRLLE